MKALLLVITLLLSQSLLAAIDVYQFANDVQKQRYQLLIEELRCPKCQNQNLADSNAPIAQDLRRELHRLIVEGKQDAEITQFMVARYGNFVLYKPPVDKHTLVLWLAPLLLLLLGIVVVWRLRQGADKVSQNTVLSAAEKQRIQELVEQYGK